MKKRKIQSLGVIAFAFLLALMIPISASACIATDDLKIGNYDGAWVPSDDSVFAFEFDSGEGHVQIYDFGTPESKLDLFSDSQFASLYFTEVKEDDNTSTWYVDTIAGGQSLLLGDNAEFGIAFSDDDETWYEYNIFGTSGAYIVFDENTKTELLIHDADPGSAPVPLPGAALLLGSGLFGLAAARIRRRQE